MPRDVQHAKLRLIFARPATARQRTHRIIFHSDVDGLKAVAFALPAQPVVRRRLCCMHALGRALVGRYGMQGVHHQVDVRFMRLAARGLAAGFHRAGGIGAQHEGEPVARLQRGRKFTRVRSVKKRADHWRTGREHQKSAASLVVPQKIARGIGVAAESRPEQPMVGVHALACFIGIEQLRECRHLRLPGDAQARKVVAAHAAASPGAIDTGTTATLREAKCQRWRSKA